MQANGTAVGATTTAAATTILANTAGEVFRNQISAYNGGASGLISIDGGVSWVYLPYLGAVDFEIAQSPGPYTVQIKRIGSDNMGDVYVYAL